MKLNKFVLIAALSVATASMASAVLTFRVYMTGSTAYRGAIFNTLQDAGANGFFAKLGGAYVEESTYKRLFRQRLHLDAVPGHGCRR